MKPIAGLERITLPINRATGERIRSLLQATSTTHQDIQDAVLADPGAASMVLRGLQRIRPNTQASDIAHAISMIGYTTLQTLFDDLPQLTIAAEDRHLGAAYAYSQEAHAALFAGALSQQLRNGHTGELTVAALLQNPAILALWQHDANAAQRATNAVRSGVSFDTAFQAELGQPLRDANQRLARAWGYPSLALQAMGDWDPLDRRLQLIALANRLAQSTAAGWHHEETHWYIELLADFLGWPEDRAASWLAQQTAQAARQLNDWQYPLPAYDLLLLPGVEEEEEEHEIPDIPRRAAAPSEPAATDLHSLVTGLMKAIQHDTNANPVAFAVLNRERTRLRVRLALGSASDHAIRRLDISLTEPTLFSLLLHKPQSLWVNADNRAKYAAHYGRQLAPLLGVQDFYAMSLFVRERPLGLVYAANVPTGQSAYQKFRRHCQHLMEQLAPTVPTAQAPHG